MSVSVQQTDFDIGVEIAALTAGRTDIGGIATFAGLVRDLHAGKSIFSEKGIRETRNVCRGGGRR